MEIVERIGELADRLGADVITHILTHPDLDDAMDGPQAVCILADSPVLDVAGRWAPGHVGDIIRVARDLCDCMEDTDQRMVCIARALSAYLLESEGT